MSVKNLVTAPDRDEHARELGPEALLDGGNVLPGFTANTGDLFDVGRRR